MAPGGRNTKAAPHRRQQIRNCPAGSGLEQPPSAEFGAAQNVLRIDRHFLACRRNLSRTSILPSGARSNSGACSGSATRNANASFEPHHYGIHDGVIKLFGFQVRGSSSKPLPNWRWAEQDLISELRLLDRTFSGGRPGQSGRHHKWDKLFIRVNLLVNVVECVYAAFPKRHRLRLRSRSSVGRGWAI